MTKTRIWKKIASLILVLCMAVALFAGLGLALPVQAQAAVVDDRPTIHLTSDLGPYYHFPGETFEYTVTFDQADIVLVVRDLITNTFVINGVVGYEGSFSKVLSIPGMGPNPEVNRFRISFGYRNPPVPHGTVFMSVWVVPETGTFYHIASIGDPQNNPDPNIGWRSSWQAAVDDAADGDTITVMSKDGIIADTSLGTVGKNITLDLAGRTLTMNGAAGGNMLRLENGASLTVQNGTLNLSQPAGNAADPVVHVLNGGQLRLGTGGAINVISQGGDSFSAVVASGDGVVEVSSVTMAPYTGSSLNPTAVLAEDSSSVTVAGSITASGRIAAQAEGNSNLTTGAILQSDVGVRVSDAANATVNGNVSGSVTLGGTGTLTVNGDITTTRDNDVGAEQGGDGTLTVNGSIYADGADAQGVWLDGNGSISVTGSITVSGIDTIGAYIHHIRAGTLTVNGGIFVTGANAIGVQQDGDGSATVSSAITVNGENSIGAHMADTASSTAILTVNGGISVTGANAIGVQQDGAGTITANGDIISEDSGALVHSGTIVVNGNIQSAGDGLFAAGNATASAHGVTSTNSFAVTAIGTSKVQLSGDATGGTFGAAARGAAQVSAQNITSTAQSPHMGTLPSEQYVNVGAVVEDTGTVTVAGNLSGPVAAMLARSSAYTTGAALITVEGTITSTAEPALAAVAVQVTQNAQGANDYSFAPIVLVAGQNGADQNAGYIVYSSDTLPIGALRVRGTLSEPTQAAASPQTGDGSNMGLWAVLATGSLASLAAGLTMWLKRKRRQA